MNCSSAEKAPDKPPAPAVFLWAWDRPENLRWIEPSRVGVAFLAQTIRLQADMVSVKPRSASAQWPSGSTVLAVTRIEAVRASLSKNQLQHTADLIARLASQPGIAGLQIDFDAKVSERSFYRDLLEKLRPQTPYLSITALASWCVHDRWMDGLPVDEVVPMLFRMGIDHENILRRLRQKQDFIEPLCQTATGIATDEPVPWHPRGRKVYIFHTKSWAPSVLQSALQGSALHPQGVSAP